MYDTHVLLIAGAMREEYDCFRRGVLFAVLSIQQPITNLAVQLADVEERGTESKFLWGFKGWTFLWLQENGQTLFEHVKGIYDPSDMIAALLVVPGLGIVKAGFVAQLMGCNVACLDTRNIRREGRPARAFSSNGKSAKQLRHKISRYVDETGGKARYYWNTWCREVAKDRGMTAEAVSALHLIICHMEE